MLDALKTTSKSISRELNRAWESVAQGWHELLHRSGNALTHFAQPNDDATGRVRASAGDVPATFPCWSLLAGEVEESLNDIVVRVELPGLSKEDCEIRIESNRLHLSGSKQIERETGDSRYHLTQRAYGSFQRVIELPRNVDTDRAHASFKNGVLTVRCPKLGPDRSRSIPIT